MVDANDISLKEAKRILKNNSFNIPIIVHPEIKRQLEEMQKHSTSLLEALVKQFERTENVMKEFRDSFKTLAEQFHPSLSTLVSHGWYISGNSAFGDSIYLSSELNKGNIVKVDKFLIKFFEKEFNSIIETIKRYCPQRSEIIAEAAKAHKLKMYYAATSLFISTADGIFDGELFKQPKKGKPKLKEKLANVRHQSELGELLIKMSPIDATPDELYKFNNPLNRHNVLHGRDFSYGTKINSLKALSLLGFICDFFSSPPNLPHQASVTKQI